jgi:hypothetical protein
LKVLEKIAQEVGVQISSLILDEKSWTKRASFDLYHSLRSLEETLLEAERNLSRALMLYGGNVPSTVSLDELQL